MLLNHHQIEHLIMLSKSAGKQAMEFYHMPSIEVTYKQDQSPVTIADQTLSDFLSSALKEITPNIPVVSEEGDVEKNILILAHHNTYWLIDPIDGTKSFIRKRGDFTVNISLIEAGVPTFGMIYHPIKEVIYYTGVDNKSYKEHGGVVSMIHMKHEISADRQLNLVLPSKKSNEEMELLIGLLNIGMRNQLSSSYKFCLLAEGQYDIYPNFSSISGWDIAAGHAILLKAGGIIYNTDAQELLYPKDSLKSVNFIAFNKKIGLDYMAKILQEFKHKSMTLNNGIPK